MTDTTRATAGGEDDQALPATARALAQRAPSSLLIAFIFGGLVVGCTVAVYRPQWWLLGVAAIVLATLGLWGVAEHALSELREVRAHDSGAGRSTYWIFVVLRAYALAAAVIASVVVVVFTFHVLVTGIGVGGG